MRTMVRWLVAAGVTASVLGGAPALAQTQTVKLSAYMERYDPQDLTLATTVHVQSWQEVDPATGLPITHVFSFDTAAVVYPVIMETGSSRLVASDEDLIKSYVMTMNDRPVASEQAILEGYPSGARLMSWKLLDKTAREFDLKMSFPSTCWNTRFDEEKARAVGWPQAWIEPAASTFKPQLFIDIGSDGKPYDMKPLKDLVAKWLGGKDPRSTPIVTLAKSLTAQAWGYCRMSGKGFATSRTGAMAGIDLQGAAATAVNPTCNEFDMVCFLAAVYREAGIPCRTVIGWNLGERRGGDRFLGDSRSKEVRAWVEFAMPDDDGKGLVWVPVDIVKLRKSSSRPRSLEQKWNYFGSHDELNQVIPFAVQFHPPTTVRAYQAPGFWGWMVTPKPPDIAEQWLSFNGMTTPKTAEDQRKQREDKQKKKGPYGK